MAYISFQPQDYFNTKLYTGNGSTNAITGVGFQPDWVWVKNRTDASTNHLVTDAVRAATKCLFPNLTNAEVTEANALQSFNSDGFTLGSDSSVNTNTKNWVSWNWRANGAGSSNTDGSITSTVSANTTSGFSIVQYTGNSTSGATVGHGLGVAPKAIILKSSTHAERWVVGHDGMDSSSPWNYFMHLEASDARRTNSNRWNNTAPTSSVFTLGNEDQVNGAKTFIAYCFAEKTGFSKFGEYTGNGNADGSFIYTGFKPAFVIIKLYSTGAENWRMFDNKRIGYNPNNYKLYPSLTSAEGTSDLIDLYSNGFKPRSTSVEFNGSGNGYIYMAFAEHPLVSSNGVPAVAR